MTFHPLGWLTYQGNRAFTWLWWSQTVSLFGSQVTLIAIPLLAAISLQATAFEMGMLAAVETVPYLVFSIPTGVLVDRVNRRALLIFSNVLRAGLLLVIPVSALLGLLSLPLLYVVAFGVGTLSVVFDVAYQSYVPELLRPAELLRGNQRIEVSESAARTVGPGIGGALVATAGGALAILFDAVSYLVAALLLLGARRPKATRPVAQTAGSDAGGSPTTPAAGPPDRVLDIWGYAKALEARVAELETRLKPAARTRAPSEGGAMAGLRIVLGDRVLRDVAISTATFNLASAAILAVFILYAATEIGMDATSIGLLYAASNIGFVLGAVAVGVVTAKFGVGPTLVVSAIGGAAATVVFPFATGGVAVALLFLGRFIGALTIPLFNVNARALRQSRAPRAALGRVNAFFRLIDWGTLPIGALLGGWIGSTYGLHATLVVAAVLGVASAIWLVVSPLWRVRRLDGETESQSQGGDPNSGPGTAPPRGPGRLRRSIGSAINAIGRPAAALGRLPVVRWGWLAIAGAALQVALSVPAVNTQMAAAPPFLYVLSVAAVLVCLLANLRIPGLAIAAVGGACNLAAIVANGGYMPVSPVGARMVGHLPPVGYSHTVETATAYLQPLTDIVVVPPPLPFANVYSIGDFLLVIGLAVTFASAVHAWNPARRLTRATAPPAAANESTGQA